MTYYPIPVCLWCGHESHDSGRCRGTWRLRMVDGHPEISCLCSAPREDVPPVPPDGARRGGEG